MPDPHDFLDLSAAFDHQERLIQSTTRAWVEGEILPNINTWFEEGYLPRSLAKDMGDLGMLGLHLEGYGCAGSSAVEYGLASMELEAGDSGVRSFMSVQGSLAMYPIHTYGSEEQRIEWLPQMASGEVVGCFALTEPDAGSDAGAMRTTARQHSSGDWVLNGTKLWITNGNIADVAIVWARADDGSVRGFVVPTDVAGFSARAIERKMSLRASNTAELVLDNVRLPSTAVLPRVLGMRGPLSCLTEARYGILWGVVGAARACYSAALQYANDREAFGGPISRLQITQQRLVEMMVRVEKAGLLALHLGRLKDAGSLAPAQVSFGKLDNVRQALWVAREARALLGANGITLDYPPIRHMLNLETVSTYEGTSEIHQLILGQSITGQSAFGG